MNSKDLLVGTTLDSRYKISEKLSQDEFGSLYKAENCDVPGQMVAAKVIHIVNSPSGALEGFEREIAVLNRVIHPNIVRLYGVFREDPYFVYTREFVSGSTLEDLINKSGRLPADRVIPILLQVTKAVELLHNEQIAHNAIELNNIIVSNTGKAKLIGFHRAYASKSNNSWGISKLNQNFAKDIQNIGTLAVNILTSDCPDDLGRIIVKALSLEPDSQYQNITELLEELNECKIRPQARVIAARAPVALEMGPIDHNSDRHPAKTFFANSKTSAFSIVGSFLIGITFAILSYMPLNGDLNNSIDPAWATDLNSVDDQLISELGSVLSLENNSEQARAQLKVFLEQSNKNDNFSAVIQASQHNDELFLAHRISFSGETLSKISQWYTGRAADWQLLAKLNPQISPNRISINGNIFIPRQLLQTTSAMPQDFVIQKS